MYFKKLVGEKCYLSPIDINDVDKYTLWLNDLEVIKNLQASSMQIEVNSEKEFLCNLAKEHNYGIIDIKTNELLGNLGLMDLNQINSSAEIGIFIGNKEYWGKGYGTEALRLLIDYAYQYLNLNNIHLRVYEFNTRAIMSYKKVGFKEIGKMRKSLKRGQKYFDIILMDILPEDFYKIN
jgi:RimJ/RimL family protein N-acetyltransferase